jgi:hypothetical protein
VRIGRIRDQRSSSDTSEGGANLAKPNYQFEKRQKDLAKKKKNEEKRQRKLDKKNIQSSDNPEQSPEQSLAENPKDSE